jgi:class 3 adenylate cyclase
MSAPHRPGVEGLLPSGTVTFVFTDIEGSTQRWERDPQAMQAALRRHDALVRSALEAAGGYVFKTIGDAFCAAFERPADALRATLALQRELAADGFAAVGGLRVRAALHTGTADERDGDVKPEPHSSLSQPNGAKRRAPRRAIRPVRDQPPALSGAGPSFWERFSHARRLAGI